MSYGQTWHPWAIEFQADAISRTECVTELMDAVRLVWEHTFQLGHRSVALDEGIFKLSTLHGARNAPAPKQGRSRFTSPGTAARSQPLVQLACAGWDHRFIRAQELLDTDALASVFGSNKRHFCKRLSSCPALSKVSSNSVSCFWLWPNSAVGDLFCFFLLLCKSTMATYTMERICVKDNEKQIHAF